MDEIEMAVGVCKMGAAKPEKVISSGHRGRDFRASDETL